MSNTHVAEPFNSLFVSPLEVHQLYEKPYAERFEAIIDFSDAIPLRYKYRSYITRIQNVLYKLNFWSSSANYLKQLFRAYETKRQKRAMARIQKCIQIVKLPPRYIEREEFLKDREAFLAERAKQRGYRIWHAQKKKERQEMLAKKE